MCIHILYFAAKLFLAETCLSWLYIKHMYKRVTSGYCYRSGTNYVNEDQFGQNVGVGAAVNMKATVSNFTSSHRKIRFHKSRALFKVNIRFK